MKYAIKNETTGKVYSDTRVHPDGIGMEYVWVEENNSMAGEFARKDAAEEIAKEMRLNGVRALVVRT